MRETIVQNWATFALALISASSSLWVTWTKRRNNPAIPGQPFPANWSETQRWASLILSKQNSPTTFNSRPGEGLGKPSTQTRFSSLGDWLAPAIVWILVAMMVIAIAAFLLGEK